jgi:hypothetical protein
VFRFPYKMHECPVCGRPLQVGDEYMGERITCPHCRGRFVACEETLQWGESVSIGESLVNKADRLLHMSAQRLCLTQATATQAAR